MNPYDSFTVPQEEERSWDLTSVAGAAIVVLSVFFGAMFLLLPIMYRDYLADWNRVVGDSFPAHVYGKRFMVAQAKHGLVIGTLTILPAVGGTLMARRSPRLFAMSSILTAALIFASMVIVAVVVYDAS